MSLRGVFLFFFLFVIPVLLGLPWLDCVSNRKRHRMMLCFPLGLFLELAFFHLLAVPFAFLGGSFRGLSVSFSLGVILLGIVSVVYTLKKRPIRLALSRCSRWETVYLIAFLALLAWQLYKGFFGDTTYWSFDDATYVTYGADAIRYDRIQTINPSTGIAIIGSYARMLQSILYFPAFLSLVTGIPTTVMNRTILETYDILLAYSVYIFMASVLFQKKENGLIFLIILCVLHVFGYYSPYSITFRLLGPNYQGKAILATSLLPLLNVLLILKLKTPFDRKACVLLMLLSATAVSLSMFGAVIYSMNVGLVVLLSLFRKARRWKHLWYFCWGSVLPAVYLTIYFIFKVFKW